MQRNEDKPAHLKSGRWSSLSLCVPPGQCKRDLKVVELVQSSNAAALPSKGVCCNVPDKALTACELGSVAEIIQLGDSENGASHA